MARAMWNEQVLAESDTCTVVDGYTYFPPDAVNQDYLKESAHTSVCHWKGVASYYDIVVDGQTNANAAWFYPDASAAAKSIEGWIGFWRGVEIEG